MRVFVLRTRKQVDRLVRFLTDTWQPQVDSEAPLEVTVDVFRGRRSDAQNKRYWALLKVIAGQVWIEIPREDRLGVLLSKVRPAPKRRRFDEESWHEQFKRKFIGYRELPTGGMVGLSTTTLSVEEFSAYMIQVEAYAAGELGVIFGEAEA